MQQGDCKELSDQGIHEGASYLSWRVFLTGRMRFVKQIQGPHRIRPVDTGDRQE